MHTQPPDVQSIIVGQCSNSGGEVLIVRSSPLTIIKSGVRLLKRSLDLCKGLLRKVNVAVASIAIPCDILRLDEGERFEGAKERAFPRNVSVDRVIGDLARLLGLILTNVNEASGRRSR